MRSDSLHMRNVQRLAGSSCVKLPLARGFPHPAYRFSTVSLQLMFQTNESQILIALLLPFEK